MSALTSAHDPRADADRRTGVLDALGHAVDAIVLGGLWLLGSLPVVTVVAAGAGADAVAEGWRARRPTPVWSTFWESYRLALHPGVRMALLVLPLAAVAVVDITYVRAAGLGPTTLPALAAGLGIGGYAVGLATVTPSLLRRHRAAGAGDHARPGVRELLRDGSVVLARSPGLAPTATAGLALGVVVSYLMPPIAPVSVAVLAAALHRLSARGVRRASAPAGERADPHPIHRPMTTDRKSP